MEVLFYYIMSLVSGFLFLSITQISAIFLLRLSNEFLKKNDFKKSYLANITSILIVLFLLFFIADFYFVTHEPLVLAVLIIVTPIITMVVYIGLLAITAFINLERCYKYMPSYRVTRAIIYLNLAAILGMSFYGQDYEQTYALHGNDMDKILQIHSTCGDGARCIGIEYNIFYNTKVTSDVLEEVVRRHPASGIACRAMENPNATEEQIRRWSNMGWAFKRCADRILSTRKH